jgi:hypothetical protein
MLTCVVGPQDFPENDLKAFFSLFQAVEGCQFYTRNNLLRLWPTSFQVRMNERVVFAYEMHREKGRIFYSELTRKEYDDFLNKIVKPKSDQLYGNLLLFNLLSEDQIKIAAITHNRVPRCANDSFFYCHHHLDNASMVKIASEIDKTPLKIQYFFLELSALILFPAFERFNATGDTNELTLCLAIHEMYFYNLIPGFVLVADACYKKGIKVYPVDATHLKSVSNPQAVTDEMIAETNCTREKIMLDNMAKVANPSNATSPQPVLMSGLFGAIHASSMSRQTGVPSTLVVSENLESDVTKITGRFDSVLRIPGGGTHKQLERLFHSRRPNHVSSQIKKGCCKLMLFGMFAVTALACSAKVISDNLPSPRL